MGHTPQSPSAPPPQLKDALDGWSNGTNNQAEGGASWPGQANPAVWPGTPIRLRPLTAGWNQVRLCPQVNLLLTPSGQEVPLEAELCGPAPPSPDLQQDLVSW